MTGDADMDDGTGMAPRDTAAIMRRVIALLRRR